MDRSVPARSSAGDVAAYSAMLGDDALVLAHRLTAWGTRAPGLEEDVVLGRIALELLVQARKLLHRSAELEGVGRDENQLAYFRSPEQFGNVRLVEIDCGPGPGGDFAASVVRLVFFTLWRSALLRQLARTRDPVLASIAAESAPEAAGHRDHAAQWLIRLGEGGEAGRDRAVAALSRLWPMVGELFVPHAVETRLALVDCGVDPAHLRGEVVAELDELLSIARLDFPDIDALDAFRGPMGRYGEHTEAMTFLLADLQHVVRSDPGAEISTPLPAPVPPVAGSCPSAPASEYFPRSHRQFRGTG